MNSPMTHGSQQDAILLLTVSFGQANIVGYKPLSVKEWSAFAHWLDKRNLQPGDLLLDCPENSLLTEWPDQERIASLLRRGVALGLLKEKMQRAGLWVLTRADEGYPIRILKQLGWNSPPVLFGSGDQALLKGEGIAIVGSRNANGSDLQRSAELGAQAASDGIAVISGGARGVDQSAMLGSLDEDGTAVGVLSDSLLRAATSAKYRDYIMDGRLVLVSPYSPEARFNVGNAMGRNRYIYCLSRAAIVVHFEQGKGGTWEGVKENLINRWVPIWFDKVDGFKALEHLSGGLPLPKNLADFDELLGQKITAREGMYWAFLDNLEVLASEEPLRQKEIAELGGLRSEQVGDWLKRGVKEGYVERHKGRPYKYTRKFPSEQQTQLLLGT